MVTVRLDRCALAGAPDADALAAVVFAATAADVHHVVIGGERVVADGWHRAIDVAAELAIRRRLERDGDGELTGAVTTRASSTTSGLLVTNDPELGDGPLRPDPRRALVVVDGRTGRRRRAGRRRCRHPHRRRRTVRDPGLRRQPHATSSSPVTGATSSRPAWRARRTRPEASSATVDGHTGSRRRPPPARARRASRRGAAQRHHDGRGQVGLRADRRRRGRLLDVAATAHRRDDVPRRPRRAAEYAGRADDYVDSCAARCSLLPPPHCPVGRRLLRAGRIRRRSVPRRPRRRRARRTRSAAARQPTRSRPRRAARGRVGCASADHCTYLTDADIEALAGSATVATFLPATDFSTRQPYPDARRVIDAGATVAIATNCNPGSSYTTSMAFCIALAVRDMRMTTEEAVPGGDGRRRGGPAAGRASAGSPRAHAPTSSCSMPPRTPISSTGPACNWSPAPCSPATRLRR